MAIWSLSLCLLFELVSLTSGVADQVPYDEVKLFRDYKLTFIRAETNKHRVGPKQGFELIPHLYVLVNVIAKNENDQDIGKEQFYYKTKAIRSATPVFNQTMAYSKGVSPGFVLGTDTAFRIYLIDKNYGKEDVLGQFELHLGKEMKNDRSNLELMKVMEKGIVGSVLWYKYDYTIYRSNPGMWGSDIQENWSHNQESDPQEEGIIEYLQ